MREPKPSEEGELEEDFIKVRLYFFNTDKQTKNKLFTEEWFIVAADHLDDAFELKHTGIPFLEVSLVIFAFSVRAPHSRLVNSHKLLKTPI